MPVLLKEEELVKIIADANSEDCKAGEELIRAAIGTYGQPRRFTISTILERTLENLRCSWLSSVAKDVEKKLKMAFPISATISLARGFVFTFGIENPIGSGLTVVKSKLHEISNGIYSAYFQISARSHDGRTEVMVKCQGNLPPIGGKVFPEVCLFLRNHCRGAFLDPHSPNLQVI